MYSNRRTSNFETFETVVFMLVIIIFISLTLAECGRSIDKGSDFYTEVGTVTDKGVKRNGESDKYLVYTVGESGEIRVYEITDSFVAGRFNSSDVYAGIEVGKTYEFTLAGERNEFMSWYPNIYSYLEIFSGGAKEE